MSDHVKKKGRRPKSAPRDLSPRALRALITFMELEGSLVVRHSDKGQGGVNLPLYSVENQHNSTLNHIPLIEWQFINVFRNKSVMWDANSSEHRLSPEARSTFNCSERVDGDEDDDSFYRSRDQAQCQSLCMIFVPGLYVECEESYQSLAYADKRSRLGFAQANKTMTVFQPIPKFCEAAKIKHSREVLTASTP